MLGWLVCLLTCSLARSLDLLLACLPFWFALLAYFDLFCLVDLCGSRGCHLPWFALSWLGLCFSLLCLLVLLWFGLIGLVACFAFVCYAVLCLLTLLCLLALIYFALLAWFALLCNDS